MYRRNADIQVRSLLRQYAQGVADPGQVIRELQRTGYPLELVTAHEKYKTCHVHIDLDVGGQDSLLGPWDLDDQLQALTETTLRRYYPNIDSYDGDFQSLDAKEAFAAVPALKQLLQAANLDQIVVGFLVSYDTDTLAPELHLTLDWCWGSHWYNRKDVITQNFNNTFKFFGTIDVVIYFEGSTIVEHEPLTPEILKHILVEEPLLFTGWLQLIRNYLPVIQHYPHFTVMGQNMDYWTKVVAEQIRISDWWVNREYAPACLFPEQAPISGVCLGLALKNDGSRADALGSTHNYNIPHTDDPSKLLTWIFVTTLEHIPYVVTSYQVYIVEINARWDPYLEEASVIYPISAFILLDSEEDHLSPINLTDPQQALSTKTQILTAAKSHDATITEIVWLA